EETGRFGWKAAQPDVLHITANALHQDMGITSELFPNQNCEPVQSGCTKTPFVSPEIDGTTLKDLVYSVMMTAVPGRRNLQTQEGKKIFLEIGCGDCHKSEMRTDTHPKFPELSNQTIYPYTDLLLHDMGKELADQIREGSAEGNEWRTPPLWGLGLYSLVNQHSFLLHDGRARNAEEAVLWHGGEAEKSRDKYRNLRRSDREKILVFLYSL
nr:di-heme oxidoredictase family protein [Leptospiraceae bacterium]